VTLTARVVDALSYARSDRKLQFVWDAKMVGLGVRLTPAGHRAYVVRYRVNGRQRLATLGDVQVHALDEARKVARSMLAKADAGVDAQSERDRIAAAGTTADAWQRYVTDRLSKRSSTTLSNYEALWRVHIQKHFGRIPIVDITQNQIDLWHREVTQTRGPYVANRAFEALRGTINWQIKRYRYALPVGFINPCYGVEKNKERPRRTILRPIDIPAISRAIAAEPDPVVRAFFWMCLYTGARKGELLNLTWDRVVIDPKRLRGDITFAETKNGDPHTVPLSSDAVRTLRAIPRAEASSFVFPHRDGDKARVNVNKAWGRIRVAAKLPDLRIHDLRRSVGSWLGANGCTAEMIGALLNHRSNITSKIYVQLGELDVKRTLVDKGAKILRAALNRRR
jgi:integrase